MMLGPVIVNILCFQVLMAPTGLPMAIVVSALALFLLWRHRENFAGLLEDVTASPDARRQHIVAAASTARS
jgi:hypothetical protein